MADPSRTLEQYLNGPVNDATGLAAKFDFSPTLMPEGLGAPDGGEAAPEVVTAVQEQLGLTLEARKALLELVVADHAERVPTGN